MLAQITCVVLSFTGFIIVVIYRGKAPHFINFHEVLGLIVTIILLGQIFLGALSSIIFTARKGKRGRHTPIFPDKAHWYTGRMLWILASIDIFVGIIEIQTHWSVPLLFAIFIVTFLISYILGQFALFKSIDSNLFKSLLKKNLSGSEQVPSAPSTPSSPQEEEEMREKPMEEQGKEEVPKSKPLGKIFAFYDAFWDKVKWLEAKVFDHKMPSPLRITLVTATTLIWGFSMLCCLFSALIFIFVNIPIKSTTN